MSVTQPNRDWWQSHLSRIEREKISTKAYADREGLSVGALYHWRKVFKSEQSLDVACVSSSKFLSVTTCSMETNSTPSTGRAYCELVLPGGIRLEMASLPSARWLAELSLDLARAGAR